MKPRRIDSVDLASDVITAIDRHPAVDRISLVGSRSRGGATALSDWDFAIITADFGAVAADLPALVDDLEPIAQQWDPLGDRKTYMLMLSGPSKVDLIFDRAQEPQSPWKVGPESLPAADHHFWDWTLWLASKHLRGEQDLVREELGKMFDHLLSRMGANSPPQTIGAAVRLYAGLRGELERRFDVSVPREVGRQVRGALQAAGVLSSTKESIDFHYPRC
jgi:hypothetical protein